MSRILVVEDDENKRTSLLAFLKERVPLASVKCAASYHSAIDVIEDDPIDVVLLDMTIPMFDGSSVEANGHVEAYGGRDLLEAIDIRGHAAVVVVVTQFDQFGDQHEAMSIGELDRLLRRDYSPRYLGCVFYDSAKEGWKESLSSLLLVGGISGESAKL